MNLWKLVSDYFSPRCKVTVCVICLLLTVIVILVIVIVVLNWRVQNNGAALPELLLKSAIKRRRKQYG